MRQARSDEGDEFVVALDRLKERIRSASHAESPELAVTATESDVTPSSRLRALQREERELSWRRRELHARIDTLEAAPSPLGLTFKAQLNAYTQAEEEVSRSRRRLHHEIDELSGVAPRANPVPR